MTAGRRRGGAGHPDIADVARRAGVSPSTVSRTLRGARFVSPGTRAKVLDAAAALSYVASPAASRLASGRTATVGVVVPFITRWFFATVVAGAEAVLREAGLDLLLYALGDTAGRHRFFERLPVRRRVDGLLVLSMAMTVEERAALHSVGVPGVVVGQVVPGLSSVRIDDVAGAADATRHLTGLGHRDVAMISGAEGNPLGFTTPQDRRAGFRRAMAAAGRPVREDLVVTAPWGVEGGARAMATLLSADPRPTAVFAESDEMAFGALRTLRRAGVDVPGEVSVVGFDDHDLATVLDLTTMAQPVRQQGAEAARLLLDAVAGGAAAAPRDVVLPTRLVVRGSTRRV